MSQVMKFTKVATKPGLHARNQHQGQYDLDALCKAVPALQQWLVTTPRGTQSIDFASPDAVKLLNKALLAHHYGVTEWDIPSGYLCPPIPGRADYVHRLAEFVTKNRINNKPVKVLDIGTGANAVYPIVGTAEYGWQFTASDIDPVSLKCVDAIVKANKILVGNITTVLQPDSKHIFKNVIGKDDYFEITMCNPPFHKSLAEANKGTQRKIDNLSANKNKRNSGKTSPSAGKSTSTALNFGGQKAELWCPGGEAAFLQSMAHESQFYAKQVLWFSTLISKKDNVRWMKKCLEKAGAKEARVVEMSQGQKQTRFVAWTFKA
ncbi:23S rRNA (adenine(1618)-N(6))-methyltransferase RlmF [Vibrio sp. FNV 38]|nr:23S rRNA (adenine(1618)-N(6))-methyltransferase RlmF [Vibrio sp. FNV 38]